MSAELSVTSIAEHPSVLKAERMIRQRDEETLALQAELSSIPAPPFEEQARAARVAELFQEVGLSAEVDAIGNVVARVPDSVGDGAIVLSAHLDTVFPAGTDVSVTRAGSRLMGPGISDDARGLATLIAVAKAIQEAGVRTTTPLLYVATVGEEGVGNLRGVQHLFGDSGAARKASGFVSLDGAGLDQIVTRGLGSRRYRVAADGPGGHSWADWGTPNPIHAITDLGGALSSLRLEQEPRLTLTISLIRGGKSINAIPQHASIDLDTRSAHDGLLDELGVQIDELVQESRERWPGLRFKIEGLGARPGGSTPLDSALVTAATDATRRLGREPGYALASTDANVPMSLGIPAVTVGCGGSAGLTHTTEEWFDNADGADGVVRALHTALAVTGVESA